MAKYRVTPKRRSALRKAQLASARARKRKKVSRVAKRSLAISAVAIGVIGAGITARHRGTSIKKVDYPKAWGNGRRFIHGRTILGKPYVGVRRKDKSYSAFIYSKNNKKFGHV